MVIVITNGHYLLVDIVSVKRGQGENIIRNVKTVQEIRVLLRRHTDPITGDIIVIGLDQSGSC